MALTGTTYRESFEYISDRDPVKKACADKETGGINFEKARAEGATIFILGNIPADLRTVIQDGMMGMQNGDFRMNTSSTHLQAVRYGLKGVQNYLDGDKKPIKFVTRDETRFGVDYKVPTDDFLNTLPNWLVNELGRVILDSNAVSEAERKNSNTQSSQ